MRTTTGKITIRNGEVVKRERDDVSEVVLAGMQRSYQGARMDRMQAPEFLNRWATT